MSTVLLATFAVSLIELTVGTPLPEPVITEEASGSAVVLLTISEIKRSTIFSDDNDFLRRLAFVETRDGEDAMTYREGFHGGIWAVQESYYDMTKDVRNHPRIQSKLLSVQEAFGIDWVTTEWSDLRKPFYSGLAARLFIFLAPEKVTPAREIQEQAEFWVQYYNSEGKQSDFVQPATGLQGTYRGETLRMGVLYKLDRARPRC